MLKENGVLMAERRTVVVWERDLVHGSGNDNVGSGALSGLPCHLEVSN
jgi:hypothetical protein